MTDTDTITDESLMIQIRAHDAQAFAVLVRRHTRRFFACAYRYTAHVQDAEDIVQDAFTKLWRKPQYWDADKGAKFTTWFTRVVTNTALDHVRKKRPISASDTIETFKSERDFSEDFDRNAQEEAIETAIQALPERQKTALNLCFYEDISNQEAADIMDVNVKALESLLMRAKAGIRDQLMRKGLLEAQNAG